MDGLLSHFMCVFLSLYLSVSATGNVSGNVSFKINGSRLSAHVAFTLCYAGWNSFIF